MPSPNVTSALNWGGYVVSSNIGNPQPIVIGVSGSWVVPSIVASRRATFSAVWIGIGGDFDKTLIQAGTEQDSIGGQTYYSAWYEVLPDYVVTIDDMNVSAGDQMNASIYLTDSSTSQWYISIADLTTGQQYQNYTYYNSSQLSAEWIVERTEVNNRIVTLADFGDVTFANCQVVLGSMTGAIGDFPYVVNVMYQSVPFGREVAPLVTVSSLNSNGSSFDVTYLGA